MLMHVGCQTIKCGSTKCRNYDGTCDGSQKRKETSNKNIHFEMIFDVGIGEIRKETRFLI